MSPPESEAPDAWIRRVRRRLRPLHPNRLRAALLHGLHRLGWHRLRLWLGGFAPRRLMLTLRWLVAEGRERRRRCGEERLTVAVDISSLWQPMTGVGWYLYRLLEAMADRDDVRLRLYGPILVGVEGEIETPAQRPLPAGPALEVVRIRIPRDFSIVAGTYANFLRRRQSRLIGRDGNAVLFAPNYLLPPAFRGLPGAEVMVVHDLSAYEVPETMRESTLAQLREDLATGLGRAARVITDSETVRGEIVGLGLIDRDRIDIAPLAPALRPMAPSSPGPDPGSERPAAYILFVGTIEPRKNLSMLIDAFEIWRRGLGAAPGAAESVQLVLCGGVGWKADAILAKIEKAAGEGWLRHVGYVSDAELEEFYSGAQWLALPSIYEGFGLPAVEAMAAGVPPLLADIPVLREVGGDAALYASPTDLEAWVDLLKMALGDPALRIAQATRAARRARHFQWSATAEATVAAWRRAVAGAGEG